MLNLVELALEKFKNVRQIQRINEKLYEIQEDLKESGLFRYKLAMVDWEQAKYEPAGKPILFTRIRGSPLELEQESVFLATYVQARTNVERFSLDEDMKTAISVVAAEQMNPEIKFDKLFRNQTIEDSKRKIEKKVHELSLSIVLKSIRRADPSMPVSIGTRNFLSTLDDYSLIAEKAVQKDEFLRVLKAGGHIDISTLESMYSRLMALVLRYPNRTATEYHNMRLDITDIDRAPAATWEELNSLAGLGYLKPVGKKYQPNLSFIKKHHKITVPRFPTLFDWLERKT